MRTYTVRSGDSLSLIALRECGSAALWREIQDLNQLPDPTRVEVGQLLFLPDEEIPEKSTRPADVVITEEGRNLFYRYVGDATQRKLGTKYKRGLFRVGRQRPEEFVDSNRGLLAKLKMSKSEINALLATSENEGNLDAVNTWDNSFMSFGMFQWTLGSGAKKGELPALMKLVKEKQPEAYDKYCSQFGVNVSADTDDTYGYLVHKGKKIVSAGQKQFFRSHASAYRFAVAGTDARVNAVQVLHAIKRFNWFYFTKEDRLGGFAIRDLLSSEYAAALLLDNHVNRPGYVVGCVARAARNTGLTFKQLVDGSDGDELRLVREYLAVRASFGSHPMTDATDRARVTKRYLDSGRISAKRGSFKSNRRKRQQV